MQEWSDDCQQDCGILKPTGLDGPPRIWNVLYNMYHTELAKLRSAEPDKSEIVRMVECVIMFRRQLNGQCSTARRNSTASLQRCWEAASGRWSREELPLVIMC